MAGGDWIDDFMEYSSGIPAPEVFRLWAAISGVAATCERRLWTLTAGGAIYPTLYTLLIGKPGSGKTQAINPIRRMWTATKELKLAPDSVSKASLVDALAQAKRIFQRPNNTIYEYHSLIIEASEFGVLMPKYDPDLMALLNRMYDTPDEYSETRRTKDFKTSFPNPQVSMLTGIQPSFLNNLFPEEAWGMGFMSRVNMVYSGETILPDLFNFSKKADDAKFDELAVRLAGLLKVYGSVDWEPEAVKVLGRWIKAGCPPAPEHPRLTHYNSRRYLHVARLAMVSAASAGHARKVLLADLQRAQSWLIATEEVFPDIFREMVYKSDGAVIQELHMFAWAIWVREKRPIHGSRMSLFLQTQVPAWNVEKILQTVVRSRMFLYDPIADLYTPRPKAEHGTEFSGRVTSPPPPTPIPID